ncbi:hypothetical protein OROMI_008296 [Orobanche minor]
MLPSSTNMSASSSRLVDILIDYLGPLVGYFLGKLWVAERERICGRGGRRHDCAMTRDSSVPAFAIFGLILRKYRVSLYVELMAGRNKKLYYVSSGATIVDQIVIIAPAANYVPEPGIQEVRIVDNAMSMSQDIPLQLLREKWVQTMGESMLMP